MLLQRLKKRQLETHERNTVPAHYADPPHATSPIPVTAAVLDPVFDAGTVRCPNYLLTKFPPEVQGDAR
jgi:hypothetical protein